MTIGYEPMEASLDLFCGIGPSLFYMFTSLRTGHNNLGRPPPAKYCKQTLGVLL